MPAADDAVSEVSSPISAIGVGEGTEEMEDGAALCLSGGGYRAMLFHVGALWRLYETGELAKLKRISSVSGGAITAGVLALRWQSLKGDAPNMDTYRELVVRPICALASKTIDRRAVILGSILPGTIGERIAAAYDKTLFKGATLQAIGNEPRFVFNAINAQTGALWRFSKAYMGDYQVGLIDNPDIPLSHAVAASSAFPPVLSPFVLTCDPQSFRQAGEWALPDDAYRRSIVLSDGGVYDNLGLETVWKRYRTVFVSDGGAKFQPEKAPSTGWLQHSYRVFNLVDNQVRSLRKRQVIAAFKAAPTDPNRRTGTYWGIRTNIADYNLPDALPHDYTQTLDLAGTPTRLKAMEQPLQERLINWGYAVCDAAMRKHVQPDMSPSPSFPFS